MRDVAMDSWSNSASLHFEAQDSQFVRRDLFLEGTLFEMMIVSCFRSFPAALKFGKASFGFVENAKIEANDQN